LVEDGDFFILPYISINPRRKRLRIFLLRYFAIDGISGDVSRFSKKSCVYSSSTLQTDRQTDGRTDGKAISIAERTTYRSLKIGHVCIVHIKAGSVFVASPHTNNSHSSVICIVCFNALTFKQP